MACYICIGWSCVFIIKPLVQNLTILQLCLLVGGGVLYTIGAVIYAKGKKLAYMHTIFHVFVVAASVMQFFVVFTVAVWIWYFLESLYQNRLFFTSKMENFICPIRFFGNNCRLFLAREMDWDNTIQFAIISGFLFFQYYNRAAKKSLLYVTV